MSTATTDPPQTRRRRRPSVLGVLGLVLLLAGIGCLGWVAYQYFGTNVVSHRAFEQETSAAAARKWETEPANRRRPDAEAAT